MMISIGVSYSYFSINNSINKKEINISSKSISIIFTDKMEISDNSITPGWRTQKSFSVENKSNDVFNYNIIIKNLINTFETEGFLQYKIISDTGYNMTEYKDVPKSSEAKDVTLVYDIDIENRLAKYYSIYQSHIYDGHLFCFTKPTSNKDFFSIKRNLIVFKSILSELSFMETNSDVISVSSNINEPIICNYDKEILKRIIRKQDL